jgi:thiamine pyrophosphate-dependent acetolactate synthase large subunit-like protein
MTQKKLDRRAVAAKLLAGRKDVVVVAGLGATAYDLAASGDHDRNFYLWGAMGGAAMIGLGLALAQPTVPVLVMTGDGETLMGMGAFASIAQHNPKNLTIAIFDNEVYGETGAQDTHTAGPTDLAAVAKACGLKDSRTLTTMVEVDALAPRVHRPGDGTTVAVIKIDAAEPTKVLPPRDGVYLMTRTRAALGFPPT